MPLSQTTRADIVVNSSHAPWMKIAKQELGKGIHEMQCYENFKAPLMLSLAQHAPPGPTLLDWKQVNADLVSSYSRAAAPAREADQSAV